MFYRFIITFLFLFISFTASGQPNTALTVVVAKGDQLGTIAQRYLKEPANSHWDEIGKFNNLKSPFKIYPGMSLRLPTHLLATQSVAAKWSVITGDVRIYTKNGAEQLAQAGAAFAEGERAKLALNASAVLTLPDGSEVKLSGGTEFVLDESRYFVGRSSTATAAQLTGTKAFAGLMRLIQGAVETKATTATDRAKMLRIQTPTAVVGVRGTDFRVSYSDATRSEVTQGLVLAQLDEARKADVAGGFGVKLNPADKEIPVPVALLEAPDLASWSAQQENQSVEFATLPSKQANKDIAAYRVQLATDPEMSKVTFNKLFASGSPVQIPELAQGTWHANVRAVDMQGIEGKNAAFNFVFKTRIDPPKVELQAPQVNQKFLSNQDVVLGWLQAKAATGYVVELQAAGAEAKMRETQNLELNLNQLPAGAYNWRAASKINSIQGAWSDWRNFSVLAKPEPFKSEFDNDSYELKLSWQDIQAKNYEIQIARESKFDVTKGNIITKTTARPELKIPNLEAGQNYLRYRAIHSDGFAGEWSDVLGVDSPKNKISLLLILGWLAIIL